MFTGIDLHTRMQACSKSIVSVICQFDGFLFSLKLSNGKDGSEYLIVCQKSKNKSGSVLFTSSWTYENLR